MTTLPFQLTYVHQDASEERGFSEAWFDAEPDLDRGVAVLRDPSCGIGGAALARILRTDAIFVLREERPQDLTRWGRVVGVSRVLRTKPKLEISSLLMDDIPRVGDQRADAAYAKIPILTGAAVSNYMKRWLHQTGRKWTKVWDSLNAADVFRIAASVGTNSDSMFMTAIELLRAASALLPAGQDSTEAIELLREAESGRRSGATEAPPWVAASTLLQRSQGVIESDITNLREYYAALVMRSCAELATSPAMSRSSKLTDAAEASQGYLRHVRETDGWKTASRIASQSITAPAIVLQAWTRRHRR